jgi:hypothetical protein
MNNRTEGGPVAVIPTPESDQRELVTQQPAGQIVQVRSAFDMAPQQFKAGLDRRKKNRDALMDWIRESLVEGTDWGRIHVVKKETCPDGKYCSNSYHFSKPSLWKSGAEKIAGMMGLRSTWPNLDEEIERIRQGAEVVILKAQLLDINEAAVSEGVGARSLEADFKDINKTLKMAKKSSLIDAVLNAGGLSEVFTQDVEDMKPENFDQGGSDPYQSGEDRVDSAMPAHSGKPLSTHCPIGKEWRNVPWGEVDEGFLRWIIDKIDDKPDLVARANQELGSRSVETTEATDRRRDAKVGNGSTQKKLSDYARDITQATTIDQLTIIRDDLPADLEPSLRTYLATRESELGPNSSTGA